MKIVVFSRVVPFPGIAHAGGDYVLRHTQSLLSLGHEVFLVAPDDARNRLALQHPALLCECHLVTPVPRSMKLAQRMLYRLRRGLRSIYADEDFLSAIAMDTVVKSAISVADRVEFQWTSMVPALDQISLGDGVTTAVIAHDVLSQKYARELHRTKRPSRLLKYLLVRWNERRLLNRVDTVLVFSEKDETYAQNIGVVTRIKVVHPPLEAAGMRLGQLSASVVGPAHSGVLFVGAFGRPENEEGALWLLNEIWELVLRQVPTATLTLAGAYPSRTLLNAAQQHSSVRVTGYVDDLSVEYREASICVIPLFSGAGVKFKTLTAMLWGVPIVSTPVGIEGVAETSDIYLGVASDPIDFSQILIRGLKDPQLRASKAFRAQKFAFAISSTLRFEKDLADWLHN